MSALEHKAGPARYARVARAGASVALVGLVGLTAAVPAAQAADPVEFVPANTYVRALDATGNDFTQAGGHPDMLAVSFEVPTTGSGRTTAPVGSYRDVRIALPKGFQGNPEAAATCPYTDLSVDSGLCPGASVVGRYRLTYVSGRGSVVPDNWYSIYNLVPPEGVAARFGMNFFGYTTMLDMTVNSDGTYNVVTNVRNIAQPLGLTRIETEIYGTPAAKNGSGGPRVPLLTMGSECGESRPATIEARMWQDDNRWVQHTTSMPALTGCDGLNFQPSMEVAPVSSIADAPSGYRFRMRVPQSAAGTSTATAPLKRAEILFPEGTAISPGGANKLGSCSDEQAKIGVNATPSCPVESRVGSVQIDTPVLDVPMKGGVYVATPKSNDSQSGEMFRIFLLASAKGIDIKQEGKLYPDPVTGRLRAVFDNAARQPFDTLTVDMDHGPNAALVNPATCGRHVTTATMESWSGRSATSESSFTIDCAPGLGGFSPTLNAGSSSLLAGALAPFNLSVSKPDGQSALSGLSLKLPKGLLANLKGNLGKQVGTVKTLAGTGAAPFALNGTVTLEGPYGDAPFSLKVVVPAKAGPYDLGDVVVRQKLYVDPETAQVSVVSDPIPTILQGVPTRIQRLDVSVDKPGFMVNPTTCEAQAIGGTLNAVTGQSAAVNVHFQVGGCAGLKYAPTLDLKIGGSAKELRNGGHPQLSASLTTGKGEANQRSAQVTLPLNLALDPQNAKALCEPAQAASNSCPQESIVGSASAESILDVPLEGPVFFVRGERTTSTGRTVATLPTLYIPLKGQGVQVNVRASSNVVDRKLQTTFDNLPDAPIERFDLQINGGANGILKVTNGDVCKSTSTPRVGQRFTGQNGKVHRATMTLGTSCRFGIAKTARKGNRLTVTVAGLTGGRVTVSGKGIESSRRTVGASSSVASVGVSLNAASRRAVQDGRTLRLKVKASFKPSAKGGKSVSKTTTVVVKPAKKQR